MSDRFYKRKAWQQARAQALHDAEFVCRGCGIDLAGLGKLAHVHHRKPLERAPELGLEPLNLEPLCYWCHRKHHPMLGPDGKINAAARPRLPRPACRVVLVCGPVGAGKSTYVDKVRRPEDQVIDLNTIAEELGYLSRNHPRRLLSRLLVERNRRLANLAKASPELVAFVILTAPSRLLRQWWQSTLAVASSDVVVLVPNRDELRRRILADPSRYDVVELHFELVDQWFERERNNDPGFVSSACNASGVPLDDLHPWNRRRLETGGG